LHNTVSGKASLTVTWKYQYCTIQWCDYPLLLLKIWC